MNFGAMTDNGVPLVAALDFKSNLPVSLEMQEQKRAVINDAFLVTLFQILVDAPAMTATEREAHEAEQRKQRRELELARSNARRDQALLIRYPNKEAHDAGRQDALAQSQMVVDAAQNRLNELAEERKKLDGEMEFYRKNPSQAPGKLRRAIEQNEEAMEQQRGVIAGQQGERERINASFDAEAERLKSVWQAAAEKR